MIKEFKKELSKLSGLDFFNPKYRDVFKRYFPDDLDKEEESTAEEERLKEVIGDEQVEDVEEFALENLEKPTAEENIDETQSADDEVKIENDTESTQEEGVEEDKEKTNSQDETAIDESSEVKELADTEPKKEQNQELVDTKVELELVKAGVREDRLEPAKRLILSEIHGLEDLDKVKEMIKQFPEWLKESAINTKPFGMPVGEGGGDLTEEEKRLKAMGIDPRN